jgi:hypothetical protein
MFGLPNLIQDLPLTWFRLSILITLKKRIIVSSILQLGSFCTPFVDIIIPLALIKLFHKFLVKFINLISFRSLLLNSLFKPLQVYIHIPISFHLHSFCQLLLSFLHNWWNLRFHGFFGLVMIFLLFLFFYKLFLSFVVFRVCLLAF